MKKHIFLLCLVFILFNTKLVGQHETIKVTVVSVSVGGGEDCDSNFTGNYGDYGFNYKIIDNNGNVNNNPNSNIISDGNYFYLENTNGPYTIASPNSGHNPSNGVIYNYTFCDASTNTLTFNWLAYDSDDGNNPSSGANNTDGLTSLQIENLNIPSENSSSTYTFGATGSSICSPTYSIKVKIERTGSPLSLTAVASQTTICEGDEITLSTSGNASAITWDNGVSDGIPFTPTQTTTYTVSGNGPSGTGSNTGCMLEDQITITVNPKPATNPITGDNSVCISGASKLYQITPVAGATYSWNIPAGFTKVAGGSSSDSFVGLQFGTVTTGQDLEVSITNSDNCTGDLESLTIIVNDVPTISIISGNSSVCVNQTNVSYSVSNTVGVNYIWTVPSGATIISGQGSNAITVNFGNVNGNVKAIPQKNGCEGLSSTLAVTINPVPVIHPSLDRTVCSDNSIGLILTTDAGSEPVIYYDIINVVVQSGLDPDAANASYPANNVNSTYIVGDIYNNTTNLPLTVTYEVKGISNSSCSSNSEFIIVSINPEPILEPSSFLSIICSQMPVGVVLSTPGASTPAMSYNLNSVNIDSGLIPDVGNATIADGVLADYISADLFTNLTSTPLFVIYEIAPVSIMGCRGNSESFFVRVNPEPVVSNTLDKTNCSNVPIEIILLPEPTSPLIATFNIISITTPTGINASANNSIAANDVASNYIANDVYINSTNGNLDVVYFVTGNNSTFCTGAEKSIIITIKPELEVVANTTQSTICAGDNITLTGSGADSYSWDNGVTDNVAFAPAATTAYTITGTSNGCSSSDQITITVNPIPSVVANTTSSTICQGEQITLTGAGADSYTWDNGVTDNVAFAPAATTTYTITGTSNGCSSSDQITITVNPIPSVVANTTSSIICKGEQITLTGSGADSYSWDNGVTDNVAFAPAATTTYTITGTTNGCSSSDQITITVNPIPSVVANTTSSTICQGEQITLTGSGADSYSWDNGVANNVAFAPAATTTYTITGTSNGCSSSDQITITVNPIPSVVANTTSSIICKGEQITLTGAGADSYSWDNGVADNVAFTPAATTTYTITGTTNGCSSSDQITVEVVDLDSNIIANGNTIMAQEQEANYSWFTCDGTLIDTNNESSFSFQESGQYFVEISKDGCLVQSECVTIIVLGLQTSSNQSVSVYPMPVVNLVTVNLNQEYSKIKIFLLNTEGKLILTQISQNKDQLKVNVKGLRKGIYILKIEADNNYFTKSIIVTD